MRQHKISGMESVYNSSMMLRPGESAYVAEIDVHTLDPTVARAVAALPLAESVQLNSTHVLQPGEVSAVSHQCGGGPHREDRYHGQAYSRPMTAEEKQRYYPLVTSAGS